MKMYSNNSFIYKIILTGASAQIINLVFDRILGVVDPQGTFAPVLGIVDMYLLAPTLLFIFSYTLMKKYQKYSLVQYKSINLGVQVFLGYFVAFTLFEIVNQRAFVFYNPGTLSIIAPIFGAYFGIKKVNNK